VNAGLLCLSSHLALVRVVFSLVIDFLVFPLLVLGSGAPMWLNTVVV
jgi:hypothetical protein